MTSIPSHARHAPSRAVDPINALVGLVVLVAVVLAAIMLSTSTIRSWPLVLGVAGAFFVAQAMPIQIRRGSASELVGFEEAIAVPALLAMYPAGAMLALLLSLPAWQLVVRQPPRRALYNAALMVVSFSAAQVALVLLVGPAPGVSAGSTFAVIVACACMFVVNQLLVGAKLALRSETSIRVTFTTDLPMKVALWAGNVSLGLLLAPSLHEMPSLLPAVLVLLFLLNRGVRAAIQAGQGERTITALVASAARLGNEEPVEQIAERIATIAQGTIGGCGAAVLLDPDQLAELADGIDQDLADSSRTQVGTRGRLYAVVRLETNGHRLGELRVWRDVADGARSTVQRRNELATLEIIARQGAVALARSVLAQRSRQHLAMIAQVFEHAHECLVLLDARGRVTVWNPATTRLVGLDGRQMLGSPIGTVSPAIAHAIEAGHEGSVEATIVAASGERRVVDASIVAVHANGADRPVTSWVVAMHDVTRAHEAERLKSDFVATVSHELRTPLTTIRGFLETMGRDDLQLDQAQASTFIDIMRGESIRLERLISDLLDTSAIEAGRPPSLRPCSFRLVDEVQRAVLSFRAAHPDVDLRFDARDEGDHQLVHADPDRLQQVLANLLHNARRHGDPRKPIEVRLLEARSGQPGVCVRDHGAGIAPDEQERVFDRFYFTADSVTRTGGGAGLGLYICRRLMHAMDGSIQLHSVPGDGATFTIRLPAAPHGPSPGDDGRSTHGALDADAGTPA